MYLIKLVFLYSIFCFYGSDLLSQINISTPKKIRVSSDESQTVEEIVSEIGSVYFDSGSFELNEKSHLKLKQLIKVLNNHPNFEILIVAHTDSKGEEEYNKKLSEKRAETVKMFLIDGKVLKSKIYIEAFGENKLKNKCFDGVICDETLHKENRRAEFVVFID